MEHKSVHESWLYSHRFQVTANRMKNWKIVKKKKKHLISKVLKDATLKRSAYLEREEKNPMKRYQCY